MTNLRSVPEILFIDEQASLANGAEISSGFIDGERWAGYQVTVVGDDTGLTFDQQLKFQSGSSDVDQLTFPLNSPVAGRTDSTFTVPYRRRFIQIRIINNTGSPITNVGLEIKGVPNMSQPTVTPLSTDPVDQSQAMLTQSVLIGQDPDGNYVNNAINQAGAILTSDFGTEVARGLYPEYSINDKFGRNPDIDSGPEDAWNGGSTYTGFNATAAELLETFSASANDTGSLVSSGTATGGSATTLINTGATFVSDGVAVGDIVINDTQGIHGYIASVDSETQVTVHRMTDGGTSPANAVGDAYRIATATSTGAAVVKWNNPLNINWEEQVPFYVILNGATGVNSTSTYIRNSRGRVVLAGSSGVNEGEITLRQATTTANVMAVMPTFGSTTIGATTVPKGKFGLIKDFDAHITRANGAAGSATVVFQTRPRGGAWNALRVYEIQTGAPRGKRKEGALLIPPETDMKFTIVQVSDTNTIMDCDIEFYLIDE